MVSHQDVEEPILLHTEVPADATLAERAYYELRDQIVTLRLPPGSLVREEEVMRDLGMSRTPIREALLRLALEKLIVAIARRGTFVSEVNVGEVGMICELRRNLETMAAGWAAARRTERDLAEVDAMLEELRSVPPHPSEAGTDARSQLTTDQRAHFLIYRLAGNDFAHDVLRSHFFLSARIWFLASGRITMDEPFDLMIGVYEAIRSSDVEEARRLSRLHSEHAESALRAAL